MKGNLLFSIAHLPTAGRMTLAVIQAKELNASLADKDTGIKCYFLLTFWDCRKSFLDIQDVALQTWKYLLSAVNSDEKVHGQYSQQFLDMLLQV